jgi:hypothetical protein
MSVVVVDKSVFCTYNPGMAKRKPGRPKGRAKGELVQFRASKAEKQTFTDAAGLAGKTVSEWIRDRLRQKAQEELEGRGRSVPFLS